MVGTGRVAVIGAGPSGLAVAKHLLEEGCAASDVVVFEAGERVGGQWARGECSAVWDGMAMNTTRASSAFSDFPFSAGAALFPRADEQLAMLDAYAAHFGVLPCVRLRHRVQRVRRCVGGGGVEGSVYEVAWVDAAGEEHTAQFARVVVCTGRFTTPHLPDIEGLASFSGDILHSSRFRSPRALDGKRVLVVGNSISALEIATLLAGCGVAVTHSTRRARYVIPKMAAGTPAHDVLFTRIGALAAQALPHAAVEAALTAAVVALGGRPEQYTAPAPHASVFVAGLTQCQGFLPAVAEGRITCKPLITRVDGATVHFADGSAVDGVDVLLLATGYEMDVPVVSEEIRATVQASRSAQALDLFAHTFHPDVPRLAFAGLVDVVGPPLPVLELQARWIARVLTGAAELPPRADMERGMEAWAGVQRVMGHTLPMHGVAMQFADLAGVQPRLAARPALLHELLFGPLHPAQFRLDGPHACADAEAWLRAEYTARGRVLATHASAEEMELLLAVERSGRFPELSEALSVLQHVSDSVEEEVGKVSEVDE